ncbi:MULTISPECIES: S1 RNA-binding domain-containing protein [unclassified Streptomyces]|uniref:S1 RNA-binding domain-containing protein n=1 Tax=unclassified Streptomyces TaxID=2593676 RepID=UPI002E13E9FC|nr:S1 RNA-binding domain-containing protein [Streptomyces sp. NBC_01205]
MSAGLDDQAAREFLASIRVGDLYRGTVAEVGRSRGVAVTLDGFSTRPLGRVSPLEVSWRPYPASPLQAGQRVTAEVTSVDLEERVAWLSMASAENPELWAFLKPLRPGEILCGTVAAIERFGVFVAMDEGPDHPVFPGVGFISIPELSWQRFEAISDVIQVGERVSCEFLYFDTWNGEARLSLRAMQPDPFQTFADSHSVGQTVRGRVTKLVPFGAFVRVADGIEGLVDLRELASTPVEAPEELVQVGDEVSVAVIDVDRERRRLSLSRRQAAADLR